MHSFYLSEGELPNPRSISLNLNPPTSQLSDISTHMVMGFGQFLDHDITLTPTIKAADGSR